LPDTIQFSTGNQIINRYAADGGKLGTEYFTRVTNLAVPLITGQVINQTYTINVINQNGTAYIDNKEYNTFNGKPAFTTLQRIYNSEGYAENITATIPNYNYYRHDHLGNNREVWLANTKTTMQRTQYYPSGLPWASNTGDNPGQQERKYNGKEFVEMHGYDTYDYGARGYYPAMGRFTSVDPLTENTPDISPYANCNNNPINMIDPDGMEDVKSTDFPDKWHTFDINKDKVVLNEVTVVGHSTKNQSTDPKTMGEGRPSANFVYLSSPNIIISYDPQAYHPVNPNLQQYFSQIMIKSYSTGIFSINMSSTTNHKIRTKSGRLSAHSVKAGALAIDINYINGIHVSPLNQNAKILQRIINDTPRI